MEYQNYNDNELVLLAKEHNEEANTILYNKYKPLITKKCSGIFKYVKNKGIEFSDLMQECLIGFEESIRNYNLDDKVTFYTFTNICMTRQLGTLVRKLNRDKHRPLNEAIPLENTIEETFDHSERFFQCRCFASKLPIKSDRIKNYYRYSI